MEEKNFKEQVIDYIKEVCESGKYDIDFDEFSVDVTFYLTKHNVSGSCIYITNECDLTYKTTLKEKCGNFYYSIYSNANPKYIAAYVVDGYVQSKRAYEEKQLKEEEEKERENDKKSFFHRVFGL